MRVTAGLPAGVSALLFEAARARRGLERSLTERLEARNYAEVLLPILDYFDPYRELVVGAERELYRFVDREGELLTLRGDFTPMLARLLAPRVRSLELPARLYYRGDVVRHREAGPAGAREQCVVGVELLDAAPGGEDGAETDDRAAAAGGEPRVNGHDEEVLSLVIELLGVAAGFDPLSGSSAGERLALVLSWAGVLDELLEDDRGGGGGELATALARRDRAAVRERKELREILEEGLPSDPGALGARGRAAVESLIGLRDRMAARFPAVSLRIDLAELTPIRGAGATSGRRGYYDGLVFQAYSPRLALPIASGGRYDRLFRELGAPLGAAGFQISLDLLLELATTPAPVPKVLP
ncbi:MAG TPA: ATP phosphoribosyltransferase regulatory subunit [Thermoanaerobaculia bacterium]|nr:ATP phosphoribosyltransferase regulatory subunit [Thermoanaerobaculia bacterium]